MEFTRQWGGRYSTQLGIKLGSGKPDEIFKWFLSAILFGARISESVAIRTFQAFEADGVISPEKIIQTGWDGLVAILDRGGYVRYDFKTATKLLGICQALLDEYDGDLNRLHEMAPDEKALEERVQNIGKGIGEVTANIFLREMRGIWPKVDSLPSDLAMGGARDFGFISIRLQNRAIALKQLKNCWLQSGGNSKDFAEFESALVRAGLYLRRHRHSKERGMKLVGVRGFEPPASTSRT